MTSAMKAAMVVTMAAALGRTVGTPPQVDADSPGFSWEEGILLQEGVPFTGVVTEHDSTGLLRASTTYRDGLRDGKAEGWHANGQLSFKRSYQAGRESGRYRGWWENGTPRFDYHFHDGVLHGEQREWLRDGTLYRKTRYFEGNELAARTPP